MELYLCANSIYWAQLYDEIICHITSTRYWYHPDYLGNVEWVTKADGTAHQFFWYTPWGEPLENQHAGGGTFGSRYKFNAKELDDETGNYYYGARYYDPKVSVWLSVDPESARDPNMTPYHFVYNNPVMIIDPNGLHGYTVDADGNVDRIKNENSGNCAYGGDEYDVLFKKEEYKSGQAEKSGHRVDNSSILSDLSTKRRDSKGYNVRYTESSDGEELFGLFKYMADNTDVEWALVGFKGEGGDETYLLGTRQFESMAINPKYLGFDEKNEVFNLHSHPRTPGASGFGYSKVFGDRRFMGEKSIRLEKQGQQVAPHFIYHKPTGQFHQYTPARKSLGPFKANSLNQMRRNAK